MNRLAPSDRYQRDPMFRALVDQLEYQIHAGNYTPTELREACILAAVIHESHTIKKHWIHGCNCYQFSNQCCDICQRITGREVDKV